MIVHNDDDVDEIIFMYSAADNVFISIFFLLIMSGIKPYVCHIKYLILVVITEDILFSIWVVGILLHSRRLNVCYPFSICLLIYLFPINSTQ